MPTPLTLLDVVFAVQDCTNSEAEVIAAIADLLDSDRVRLGGRRTGRRFPSPPGVTV